MILKLNKKTIENCLEIDCNSWNNFLQVTKQKYTVLFLYFFVKMETSTL